MEEENFIFENTNEFNIIIINPTNIDSIDWKDKNYIEKLLELDSYTIINTKPDTFVEILSDTLISKFKDRDNNEVKTQVIFEMPDYIFELLYVDNTKSSDGKINVEVNGKVVGQVEGDADTIVETEKNGIATLLNTNGDVVYGNALLMKTYIPSLSKQMLIVDTDINDVKTILESRVKTNIVVYDGEWSDSVAIGNIEEFAKNFFEDAYIKLEIPFLLHNINIWYETCDGCSKTLCGNILDKPIYKCIWFTIITDEYRGSITLKEVNKIINISKYLEFPFNSKSEWLGEEEDDYNRKVIKNKYRILDLAYNELVK
jgi:hypothetical protein